MTDELPLLERMGSGDPEAFTAIYRAYAKGMYIWASNILRNTAQSEDIVQDVFLSLWQHRRTLHITTSLKSYLFTAVRNKVYTAITRNKVTESLFYRLEERAWGEPSAENLIYQKELQARLSGIVGRLPDKTQLVYRLSREQQLSHKEIAAKLGLTVKGVEFHIGAALKTIRASFTELLPFILFFVPVSLVEFTTSG